MERTEVLGIDGASPLLKFRMNVIPESEIILHCVESLGDAGLIGDNHQELSLSFCPATDIEDAIDELAIFNFVDVALIDAYHAVTIQEQSGVQGFAEDALLQLALGQGKAFRDADVDEVALRSEEPRVKRTDSGFEDVLLEGKTAGKIGGEELSPDLVNTGVDETWRVLGAFFKQGENATIGNLSSTVAVGILHVHQHEAEGVMPAGEEEFVVIDLDVRIAIEDKGIIQMEEIEGLFDGAAGAEGFGLLGIKNRNAQIVIPEMLLNHLLHEGDAEDDLPRVREGDIAQKQLQERNPINIRHRFRAIREDGAKPRAETSRQNHDALRRQRTGAAWWSAGCAEFRHWQRQKKNWAYSG